MMELSLLRKSKFFIDGQQVIDFVKELLSQDVNNKPIEALLLDFKMPKKNGL
jgi:hypothetical protein